MILVTGAAGFIGSRVVRLLLDRGHEVTGIDNLNDAYDVRLKQWRLEYPLGGRSGFTFRKQDITDLEGLRALVKGHRFDAVINLAARAGVRPSVDNPWSYYKTNVIGTLNLLVLCRDLGVPKLVLASTSSVYGNGDRPFREDAPTSRPISPYAASKKAAEELCHTYHHLFGLDVTVLRYFTVYGPAGRPDMSIYRFIHWISRGEPVYLHGDGRQERDFTYVEDIARGTVAAMRPTGYEVVNLGGDRPVSILTVIHLLEGLLNAKAHVEYGHPHASDVAHTWADISRAKELLDWSPETSLEFGLSRTVDWHRANADLTAKVMLP